MNTDTGAFFWQAPQYIQLEQQEFYPQSGLADAFFIHVPRGWTYELALLSEPALNEQVYVGYSWWDDNGIIGEWHYNDVYAPPLTNTDILVTRDGQNTTMRSQVRVSVPARLNDRSRINGKPTHTVFNQWVSDVEVGDGPPWWYAQEHGILVEMLTRLNNLERHVEAAHSPGFLNYQPFVTHDRVFRGSGVKLARVRLIRRPVAISQGAGALPILYQGGHISFGRKDVK